MSADKMIKRGKRLTRMRAEYRFDYSNAVRGKYYKRMVKPRRNIGQEILDGIREIKHGKHGRVVVRRAPARIKGLRKTTRQ